MSTNPSNGLWWLAAVACCWPGLTFVAGILLASAFQRGWLRSPINRERTPHLPWGRRSRDER